MLIQTSLLASLSLITLSLAHDPSTVCKDAPIDSLRCCNANSYAICGDATPACQPVPFNGTCISNQLDMQFPDVEATYEIFKAAGIIPDDLVNEPPQPTESPTKVKRAPTPKQLKKTHKEKMLGLSPGAPAPTGPPLACQVVGNVVLDRCDLNNAVFDHWLGDGPCDYGC